MSKCLGCGININSNNLCERCFRIKHYNDYKKVDQASIDFECIKSNITKDDLVVLVVDLLNIPNDFDMVKDIKSNIILALTKFDLMPNNNEERYIKYFNRYNLNIIDTIIISSLKNYNLDSLYSSIKNNLKSNNVYFIGYTNAGKSSLINKLIYNYTSYDSFITTSSMPNTTLGTISIKLDDFTLIDTPGIVDNKNITNYLESKQIKKISAAQKIKPITYQIQGTQFIKIDDFIALEVSDNNIIIYMPNNLKIDRYYKKIDILEKLNKNVISIESVCDLVIPGLGFIKVLKPGTITLYKEDKVGFFLRDNII